MTKETIPPGRGGRLSRRVTVKLKPGPRKTEAGTITPKARSKMLRISQVAAMLVHDGDWPSPKAVAAKASDLPVDTVKRYIAALDPARRLWVAKFGRHPHWDDPEAGVGAGPAIGDVTVATGVAANDDAIGDHGDGADIDGTAIAYEGSGAEEGAVADRNADAPAETPVVTTDTDGDFTLNAAADGVRVAIDVTEIAANVAPGGSATPSAEADEVVALRAELDLANRRVERLTGELAAERSSHADTRTELENERIISARLLKGFKGPSLVYTEADAEMKQRNPSR